MILVFLAALIADAPACPEAQTADAYVCKALNASSAGEAATSADLFEQGARLAPDQDPARDRMLAAAGNMWIAAGEPGKAALALDTALAGGGLQAEQLGEALLDRARAAEAQNDLKTARAKLNEAAATISADPFYWYFSAALAIREGDKATAQSAINQALALAPGDATVLFEAGHVAHFAGDEAKARDYWTQASAADPNGPSGKAARDALALMTAPVTEAAGDPK